LRFDAAIEGLSGELSELAKVCTRVQERFLMIIGMKAISFHGAISSHRLRGELRWDEVGGLHMM
jgi:hypothetical protein